MTTQPDWFTRDTQALQPLLHTAAYRLTGNYTQAQDLVQDTLLKAWACRHQYTQGTNFRAWLMTIMRNTFINDWRGRQRRPLTLLDDQDLARKQADTQQARAAEDEALDGLVDPVIRAALATLPAEQSLALYLCDVEGFTYAEIAERMGTPIGTVMSRIHRARAKFRAAYTTAA